MAHLTKAQNQYFTRPEDERFRSLADLQSAVDRAHEESFTATPVPKASITLSENADGTGIVMHAPRCPDAELNHWSYSQLSTNVVGMPGGKMSKLPVSNVVNDYNVLLQDIPKPSVTKFSQLPSTEKTLLVKPFLRTFKNGKTIVRALTGADYGRVSNSDLVRGLRRIEERGWTLPPDWSGNPSGAFYSDRSLFVLMIDDINHSIVHNPNAAKNKKEDLGRFIMLQNSEEGNLSFVLDIGYMRFVCGNLMIWNAERVHSFKLRHSKYIQRRIAEVYHRAFNAALNPKARETDILAIQSSMQQRLLDVPTFTSNKDFLEKMHPVVVRKTKTQIPVADVKKAIEITIDDGLDPRTTWGMVQGLTAVARDKKYEDDTITLVRAASKLMPTIDHRSQRLITN